MDVGLCYNLKRPGPGDAAGDRFAEWDDQETISAVREALARSYRVVPIEANERAFEKFRRLRPHIVFNIAEGLNGRSRESQIPAMLEMLKIPYTGSDPLTLALCLDKARAKEVLAYYGIATPPFAVVRDPQEKTRLPALPAVVKPLAEGSSKGVANSALVRTRRQLREEILRITRQYEQPALVEKYLPGREFTAALLGNGRTVEVLPVVEIRFDQLPKSINPIYSYEAKWIWDTVEKPLEIFSCPAQISPVLKRKIEALCRAAFWALGCRDWCRIDLRLDEKSEPQILELNPLPGILPNPAANSCFPKAARTAGISYADLINRVLEIACRRLELCP